VTHFDNFPFNILYSGGIGRKLMQSGDTQIAGTKGRIPSRVRPLWFAGFSFKRGDALARED
jgi:hypothetical protein